MKVFCRMTSLWNNQTLLKGTKGKTKPKKIQDLIDFNYNYHYLSIDNKNSQT
jgi:hypothetical protein